MPTPPPWWIETQVAPLAQLSNALRKAQSDTASEPSFIASVSRFGLATDPASRWSRPMTIGAFSSPFRTISRSEEHTSELQSLAYLVCRLLLEKKKKRNNIRMARTGTT